MDREKVFTTVIKENESLIYKVARAYTDTEEDRCDLFQEIVIQAWRAFGKFRRDAKVSTWLYRIAMNTAITGLRKRKKGLKWISFDTSAHNYPEPPSEALEEKLELLYRWIRKLNELDKGIILLYLEDKNYGEIAEIIGISETNVGTRIGRIKEKLKSNINKNQ